MYTKKIPFKDFKGNPRNAVVAFNLTETQVFKLSVEFKKVFDWREAIESDELQALETSEVIDFYNAFEEILLSAWGEPSEDGLHFRKSGRYDFEESALFSATMNMFVTEPNETMKLLNEMVPKDMEDMVRKQAENLEKMENDPGTEDELRAEIAKLRSQIPKTLPSDNNSNTSGDAPSQE